MKTCHSKKILIALILIGCQSQSEVQNQVADVFPEKLEQVMAAIEAAVPLAEKDPYRPIYHFRPPAQWMNDVCGAFYYKGWHHIFFQFNPFAVKPGKNVGWGHARSKDLVNWEFLPPALLPDQGNGSVLDGSGSASFDPGGNPILFFTMTPVGFHNEKDPRSREQWAALPVDEDLIGWSRVDIGLAPGKSGVPEDIHRLWADMFVFQAEGRSFAVFKESEGMVVEAQNPNLLEWKAVGRLDSIPGECPNLFPLDNKHVLILSTLPISYRIGRFDVDNITLDPETAEVRVLDYGPGSQINQSRPYNRGLYGTNVFKDAKGRSVLLGWVSGFQDSRGWKGCMSLPRILTLDADENLLQTPIPELTQLRGREFRTEGMIVTNEVRTIEEVNGDALEIIAEFLAEDAEAFGLKIRQSEDGAAAIVIRYANGNLNVGGTDVPLTLHPESKSLKLRIFHDKSVLEVFINDGMTSVTRVYYAGENDLGVSVFAEGGSVTLKSLEAWEMKSIW